MKTLSILSQRSFVVIWFVWMVYSGEQNIRRPSLPRLRQMRESFCVTKFPWSITTQYSRRFSLLTFVEPRILQLFLPKSAVSFALSYDTVHIFFIDRFGRKITLSGGASCKMSIEMPSLARMSSSELFSNVRISTGFKCRPFPKSFIPRRARSLAARSLMRHVIPLTLEVCIWATNACWFREVGFEVRIHCTRCSVGLQFLIITRNSVTNLALFWWREILSRILKELFLYQNRRDWEQLNFRKVFKRLKVCLANKMGECDHNWKLDFIVGGKVY